MNSLLFTIVLILGPNVLLTQWHSRSHLHRGKVLVTAIRQVKQYTACTSSGIEIQWMYVHTHTHERERGRGKSLCPKLKLKHE